MTASHLERRLARLEAIVERRLAGEGADGGGANGVTETSGGGTSRDRPSRRRFLQALGVLGLGLSIVDQLATAHGWDLSLDPDHDGARFVDGCDLESAATESVSRAIGRGRGPVSRRSPRTGRSHRVRPGDAGRPRRFRRLRA